MGEPVTIEPLPAKRHRQVSETTSGTGSGTGSGSATGSGTSGSGGSTSGTQFNRQAAVVAGVVDRSRVVVIDTQPPPLRSAATLQLPLYRRGSVPVWFKYSDAAAPDATEGESLATSAALIS